MAEPLTLTALLVAGAAAGGTELVKETTKDAYKRIKEKIGDLFGGRASKALTKVEDAATRDEGQKELERYVGNDLQPDEAAELEPLVSALVQALKEDAAASQVVHARVGLDIEAGGNALIRDIQGAREIAAKVRADKDVTIEGIRMDTGRDPGK